MTAFIKGKLWNNCKCSPTSESAMHKKGALFCPEGEQSCTIVNRLYLGIIK